jgi:hypothetical protein
MCSGSGDFDRAFHVWLAVNLGEIILPGLRWPGDRFQPASEPIA